MPTLSEIRVYPVKSLDPELVDSAELAASGALALDRRYALFDADDDCVNGKDERQTHRLRSATSTTVASASANRVGTSGRRSTRTPTARRSNPGSPISSATR